MLCLKPLTTFSMSMSVRPSTGSEVAIQCLHSWNEARAWECIHTHSLPVSCNVVFLVGLEPYLEGSLHHLRDHNLWQQLCSIWISFLHEVNQLQVCHNRDTMWRKPVVSLMSERNLKLNRNFYQMTSSRSGEETLSHLSKFWVSALVWTIWVKAYCPELWV